MTPAHLDVWTGCLAGLVWCGAMGLLSVALVSDRIGGGLRFILFVAGLGLELGTLDYLYVHSDPSVPELLTPPLPQSPPVPAPVLPAPTEAAPAGTASLAWVDSYRARAGSGDRLAALELGRYLVGSHLGETADMEAVKWLRLAEPGYADASDLLGELYESGRGVPRDAAEARRRYLAAPPLDDPGRALHVAGMLRQGIGGPADPARALRIELYAARHASSDLLADIGTAYLAGEGTAANPARGIPWLTAAADSGSADAMRVLGLAYLGQSGVAADPALAYRWLALAVRRLPEVAPPRKEAERGLRQASSRLSPAARQAEDALVAAWQPALPRAPS